MTAPALEIEYERPMLYPKQEAFLYTPARYSITEASTKSGKTVGCMAWLTELAAVGEGNGRNYWWVAPTMDTSRIAFNRLKRAIPRAFFETNDTRATITLANGAILWFKGGDRPDSLYGEDVFGAVMDEASRIKEDAWYAVRSTLTATRAPVRIIGNVKGRRNWAYNLARKAEAGAPDMAYFKLTAYDAIEGGILDPEEVEDAKQNLPENVFRELYLAEPSDDGGNPFGIAHIRACIQPEGQRTGPPAVWGWDLGKSVDWTVGIALDRNGHTCKVERFQNPWEVGIPKIVAATGKTPGLVDSTGAGDPILVGIRKAAPNSSFEGYHFSPSSKQQLMEGLAVAIQRREVSYPDGPIVRELETFEYEYTRTGVRYSAPEGLHDDCVCSLALAVHKLGRTAPSTPYGIARHHV